MTSDSNSDGTNCYGLNDTGSNNQIFIFNYVSTKDAYTISCYNHGPVVTYLSYESSLAVGSNVSFKGAYNNNNIYWKVEGTSSLSIRPLGNTALCLSMNAGYGTAAGTASDSAGNITLRTYSGSSLGQIWTFKEATPFVEGKYYIKSTYSNLYIMSTSYSSGAAVIQNPYESQYMRYIDIQYTSNNNQKFELFIVPDGRVIIRCKNSTQAFDVEGPSVSPGVPIQTWTYQALNQQIWNLLPASTDQYSLKIGYTVQNAYNSNCDMGNKNYSGFANYANRMETAFGSSKTLFKYMGTSSWSNFESAIDFQESTTSETKYVSCLSYYDTSLASGTMSDTIFNQSDVARKNYYCKMLKIPLK